MKKKAEKRNILKTLMIQILLWINWELEWILPFEINQFRRSLKSLSQFAGDDFERYPELTSPSWILNKEGQWEKLPDIPKDFILFYRFFLWMARNRQLTRGNPHSSHWQEVIQLVKIAKKGQVTDFSIIFPNDQILQGDCLLTEDYFNFLCSLMEWLASFAPKETDNHQIVKTKGTKRPTRQLL